MVNVVFWEERERERASEDKINFKKGSSNTISRSSKARRWFVSYRYPPTLYVVDAIAGKRPGESFPESWGHV